MKLWDLRKDSVIFTEGSLGGTCFLIVDGSVNVSVDARGRHQLLATPPTGSIFGQVSLADD
jgi:CRP-like cAMP-binding protein